MFILNRNNIKNVSDLLDNPERTQMFRHRLMDPKYENAFQALIRNNLDNQIPARELIFVNGKYKPIQHTASKTIRMEISKREQQIVPKMNLSGDDLGDFLSKV